MALEAWWIIILPDGEVEFSDTLGRNLERNLYRWSKISDFVTSDRSPRWWCIDKPQLEIAASESVLFESLKKLIRNPLKDIDTDGASLGGNIRADRLNIAIVGNIMEDIPRMYFHTFAKMFHHVQEQLFPGITLSVNGIAFLSVAPAAQHDGPALLKFFSELSTMMKDRRVPDRPFDHLVFVQEQNNVSENTDGYVKLSSNEIADLVSQSLFHLMIGDNDVLREVKRTYQAEYLSIGSAGLFYDADQFQRELGANLVEVLLEKFKNGTGKPFVNEKLANGAQAEIESRFNIQALFEKLALGENKPFFMFNSKIWESPKDSQGKPVSPWAMHRKELLYIYFLKYLRNLPVRLTEYMRMYLTLSMHKYRDFLAKRKMAILEGNRETQETGLKDTLSNIAGGILKGKHGSARSLGQIGLFTKVVRDMCDVGDLKNKLTHIEGFRGLKVFQVPDYLKEFYDLAPERLDPETEKVIYKRIVDTIRSHPVPTALLIRTVLLSVLVAFSGFYVAKLLSPNIIDLRWFLDTPGIASVFLCLIPFVFAFWRYKIKTLNLLWKEIKRYIASALRHTESRTKDLITTVIEEVYEEVHKLCDEIDAHCEMLRKRLKCADEKPEGYAETGFFFSILGEKNVPGTERAIKPFDKKPDFQLKTFDVDKPLERLNDEEINKLIGMGLDGAKIPQTDGQTLSGLLGDTILKDMSQETFDKIAYALAEFCMQQYDSVPSGLHTLLATYLRQDSLEARKLEDDMKTLAFPPLVLATGSQRGSTVFEAKCDDNGKETIGQFFSSTKTNGVSGSSLLSIAGFQPILRLENIANIRALRTSVDPNNIEWKDASAIFTLAMTEQEPDVQGMWWVFDGKQITMESEMLRRISELKNNFVPDDQVDEFYQDDM